MLLEVVEADPARDSAAQSLVQLALDTKDNALLGKVQAILAKKPEASPVARTMLWMNDLWAIQGNVSEQEWNETLKTTAQKLDDLLAESKATPIRIARAQVALMRGNYAIVDQILDAVLKAQPRHAKARLIKASSLMAQNQPAEAEKILFALKTDLPNWADAHFAYGQAAMAAGKRELATQAMRVAVGLQSDHAGARRFLAESLLRDGFYEEAFNDAEAYYRGHPGDPVAIKLLVRSAIPSGRPELARQVLEASRQKFANRPDVLLAVADGYVLLGDRDEAVATVVPIAEMKPRTRQEELAVARAKVLLGRSAEAERTLEQAVKVNPNSASASLRAGPSLRRHRADAAGRRAVQQGPAV